MAGKVDNSFVRKMQKKLKLMEQDPKKHNFGKFLEKFTKTIFFCPCDFLFNFCPVFKNAYINPSVHFVFYEIL